jgi:hypothetical protein
MRADPVTSFVPDEDIASFLGDIAEVIEDVANEMPDHGEFVRRLPPSTMAASAPSASLDFALKYERGSA